MFMRTLVGSSKSIVKSDPGSGSWVRGKYET